MWSVLVFAAAEAARADAERFSEPARALPAFGADDGWRVDDNPRLVADVNGDGRDDIIGFADDGVVVAVAVAGPANGGGPGFSAPSLWLDAFGRHAGGWQVGRHVRQLADVDGDGLHDIIGFGEDGVYVALSLGDRFAQPERWTDEFAAGEPGERPPRVLADVDGDGTLDIVEFTEAAVRVARGSGRDFQPSSPWGAGFGDGEWLAGLHPRLLGDVSGDGLADIVGFHDAGVFVGLSTGAGFLAPARWLDALGAEDGFESQDRHPRVLADVDGDAHADILAFAPQGVLLARSTGDGFTAPELVLTGLARDHGRWDRVADVDDDGMADIVGFHDAGVFVSRSLGDGFTAPALWAWGYGADQGWQASRHPRLLGDVDDDGQLDVFGFHDDGLWLSLARP